MNPKNPSIFRTLFAGAVVTASAMLAACEPVVGTANAAQADAPAVATTAVYFGVEYADVQARLPADSKPAAPTF